MTNLAHPESRTDLSTGADTPRAALPDSGTLPTMRRQGDTITRALAAATASLLGLGLAGCTGSPSPAATSKPPPAAATASATPKPTPSPAPEPTPTPTADLPDVTVAPSPPDALNGPPSDENAAAVAEYYLSLYPYLRATGDARAWESLAGPSCGYCAGILDDLDEMVARGEHTVDGAIVIESSGSRTFDDEEFFAWVVMYEHASRAVDARGRTVEEFPAEVRFRVDVALTWAEDRWQVDGVNATRVSGS